MGRNLAYAQQGAVRKFQAAQARGREALGIPAAYGAPVMMPPTNRLGGALQIQVIAIYSGFGGGPLMVEVYLLFSTSYCTNRYPKYAGDQFWWTSFRYKTKRKHRRSWCITTWLQDI